MTSTTILFSQRGRAAFQVPLRDGSITFGRGGECSVCLPDPDRHLSRVHFEVQRRSGIVLVVDRSANGTWVGGARLDSGATRTWAPGETMQIPGWRAELRGRDRRAAEDTSNCSYLPSNNHPAVPGSTSSEFVAEGLLGRSAPMLALFDDITRFARHDVPVLIRGETGTGKELVARAVHARSPRAGGSFVAVNCGGIHEATAASRLFGHLRGAFTGAVSSSAGAFRDAAGGTLFLDELGELPRGLQAALLRAIETHEVVPLGSSRPIAVDFRLVAATHRNLESMVASGQFRSDLLFRLNVATLRVPPLRHRRQDIELLTRHFLDSLAVDGRKTLDAHVVRALEAHSWPGNVRELRNGAVRALLAADGGRILIEHFELGPTLGTTTDLPIQYATAATDRKRLVRALHDSGGNRKEAAQSLGIARSTLYERLRRWGIE